MNTSFKFLTPFDQVSADGIQEAKLERVRKKNDEIPSVAREWHMNKKIINTRSVKILRKLYDSQEN